MLSPVVLVKSILYIQLIASALSATFQDVELAQKRRWFRQTNNNNNYYEQLLFKSTPTVPTALSPSTKQPTSIAATTKATLIDNESTENQAILVNYKPHSWAHPSSSLIGFGDRISGGSGQQFVARENKMDYMFNYMGSGSEPSNNSVYQTSNSSDDTEDNLNPNDITRYLMTVSYPEILSGNNNNNNSSNSSSSSSVSSPSTSASSLASPLVIKSQSNTRPPALQYDDSNSFANVGHHNQQHRWPQSSASIISDSSSTNARHYNHQTHNYNHQAQQQQLLGSNTILTNHKSKFIPSSAHATFANNLNFNYIHSLLTKPPLSTAHHHHHSASNSAIIVSNLLGSSGAGQQAAGGSDINGGQQQSNNHNNLALSASSVSLPPMVAQNSLQNYHNNQPSSVPLSSYIPAPAAIIGNNLHQQVTSTSHKQENIQDHQQQANSTTPLITTTVTNSVGDFPGSTSCGRQQIAGAFREPRIVGGNHTYEGEFPWAVSIQRHGNHHCGGVIVGRRWILTAAHCVRSQLVGNLLVRTGGSTLSKSSNSLISHLERDYLVEQIVMHNDFSRYDNLTSYQLKSSANTNNADIALLKLKHEIHLNEFAWPVCFPNKEAGNFSGHDAIVIGWGKLNEKSEDFSNELQKVKLTIIDNKICQNWFRQAGREMPIDERIICAGFKNGGKDACHGDSGGPLLSRINGQYVVVGVVSTGIGCARPLLPGLYSRVSSYIGWLERYIVN